MKFYIRLLGVFFALILRWQLLAVPARLMKRGFEESCKPAAAKQAAKAEKSKKTI